MATSQAAWWLCLEAAATAIGYATLAVGRGATRGARWRLVQLALVLVLHAALAVIVSRVAGMPGDLRGQLVVRALFAALAVAAWGVAAALARARLEPGLAAALGGALMVVLVLAPVPGEAAAAHAADPTAVRTAAYAASPAYVASVALGLDVRLDAALYARLPAAIMETHMLPWIWTAGAFATLGFLASLIALARRPRRGALLAASLLLLVSAAACKKKTATDQGAGTGSTAKTPDVAPLDAAAAAPTPKGPTAAEIDAAIAKGVDFLAKGKGEGDIIGGHAGVSAMAALAMVSAGVPAADPRVAPVLEALAKMAKPDGAIFDKDFSVYVTALAVLAFQRGAVHPELVEKAQRWLADKQFDESNKVDPKDPNYGGVGYGVEAKEPDADLSNFHFVLDALKDAPITDKAEVMARAQKFLDRCQNRSESNDQPWAGNDGGYVYKPGHSKAGGTTSSGSMTYAGIAGLLYTQAAPTDPRVTAALDYIRANYTVDENPGMGLKGLFYHHHMMARALGLVGQRTLVDSDGQSHDWPAELAAKLMGMQKPDGSWVNTDETFWENNAALATSRAVLALQSARDAMK